MEFFLCVLGMVMIVEGLPYFAAPEKMKYWVQKVVTTPDSSLRRLGLVLMVIGLFLVFVLGFFLHCAGICTLAAVAELLSTRRAFMLWSYFKTIVWI